jgi:hypothetical protein
MNSIPPIPKDWAEQKPYIGKVNQVGATNLIAEIQAGGPHSSFHFVISCILEKQIEENRVLAFEDNCTVPRLAWATRNAMELRVLSRYVCQSGANLKRFQDDVTTTGATTMQSVIRLCSDWAKELGTKPVSPEIYRGLDEVQSAMQEAGLSAESALMAR